MPRLKSQNKAIRDERRNAILEASVPLFAIHGRDGVTMDMISDEAKCSHGLIYHYFDNIEEVYSNAINSKAVLDIKGSLFLVREEALANDELYRITKALLSLLEGNKLSNAYLLLILNEDEINSLKHTLVKLIAEGQETRDVVGGDPEDIASAYLYIFKGCLLNKLLMKKFKGNIPNIDTVYEIFRKRSRM